MPVNGEADAVVFGEVDNGLTDQLRQLLAVVVALLLVV